MTLEGCIAAIEERLSISGKVMSFEEKMEAYKTLAILKEAIASIVEKNERAALHRQRARAIIRTTP